MGAAVSILSYAGHVQVGVLTDEGLVPDPETIVTAFHDEFEELLSRAHAAEARPARQNVPGSPDDSTATRDSEPSAGVASAPEKVR
jgi:hypothetical protein